MTPRRRPAHARRRWWHRGESRDRHVTRAELEAALAELEGEGELLAAVGTYVLRRLMDL